jgi:hypothetical protein
MRFFKLINLAGDEYDLNSREHFFRDVKGMGFDLENTYQRRGRSWIMLESNVQQKALTGKIRFKTDAQYRAFVLFCRESDLTLIYKHEDTGEEYKRIVQLTSVTKDEKDRTRTYDTSVTFTPLSAWYKEIEATVTPTTEVEPDEYPLPYPFRYAAVARMEISTRNEAENDSPAELYIYGPCTNPSWRHYANGVLMGTGAITAEIPSGDYVVISTAGGECSIVEYDKYDQRVRDLYNASDFSTERFIYLQRGRNRIVVSAGSQDVQIRLRGRIEYVSV